MRFFVATLVVGLALLGCDLAPGDGGDGDGDGGTTPSSTPPSPVRRLTADELNRTLGDLFPGPALPPVFLTEERGKGFAQDTLSQVVSDLYVEQLRAGINAATAALASDPARVLPRLPTSADDEAAVVDEWLTDLLPRAFRRPVSADDDIRPFHDFYDARRAAGDDVGVAVQLVLQAILQSPDFIYRLELVPTENIAADDDGRIPVTSIEMASRLSYFVWGTTPDAQLLAAAAAGDLATSEGLQAQARRLLDDPRAQDAILDFHTQWLDFDRILNTNKSPSRFPQFNDFVRQAMRREADQFIALTFEEDPSIRALLTSRRTRLLPGLGPFYGVNVGSDDALVELPGERAGILTQAQFLASRGHALEGSPVLRGVFVLDRLICEPPPQPGGDVDTTPPSGDDPEGPQTNRQRYARHSQDESCIGCHRAIDGVGFGLEAFDAVGQFRTTDNGLPVDATGTLDGTRIGGDFDGARALGETLAADPVVHDCVARHWFRFANGRREQGLDENDVADFVARLEDNDTRIPALLEAIVMSDSFRLRRAP